jgi:hypothetical protein
MSPVLILCPSDRSDRGIGQIGQRAGQAELKVGRQGFLSAAKCKARVQKYQQ